MFLYVLIDVLLEKRCQSYKLVENFTYVGLDKSVQSDSYVTTCVDIVGWQRYCYNLF